MDENHIKVTFSEPVPTRVLLEEDLYALKTLSDLIINYSKEQPGDPIHFNSITKAAFLSIAKTLSDRVRELSIDYSGGKYIIMAKGRRRLTLGFKREPDIYIGSDYGVNFIDACRNFFMTNPYWDSFNQRKITFCGRILFGFIANDIYSYESGIKKAEEGYSTWFKVSGQTYTLTHEETMGDAVLQRKMLNRTFASLMTLKKTKP
jgi:hypothetical protein